MAVTPFVADPESGELGGIYSSAEVCLLHLCQTFCISFDHHNGPSSVPEDITLQPLRIRAKCKLIYKERG